jgi:flagellar basal body-associated protein FliL
MAEKAEKKPDAPAAPAKDAADKKEHGEGKKAAGGGLLAKTPVLFGIVMVVEAVVLFAGFKFLGGGPSHASAVGLTKEEPADEHGKKADGHGGHDEHGGGDAGPKPPTEKERLVEVLQNFKAINSQNGRRFIYDLSISAVVNGEFEEKVKDKVKSREALIKDRVRTIVAQLNPDKLGGGSEPGLETLQRQIKYQLEIIIGEGMIEQVLVPQCTPYRADF